MKTLESKAYGSLLQSELDTVADTLQEPFGRKPTCEEVKKLLLGQSITNGTKTLKLDANFYTFCYGACMNPSVGFEIGKYTLTEPGKPTATGKATIVTTVP